MNRLSTITFTGIDNRTKKQDLIDLHREFPVVEFGFLTSNKWKEQGNRYPNPKEMQKLYDQHVSYSLHLCGRLARLAIINDYKELKQTINPNILNYFTRMQINLGKAKNKEKYQTSYPSKNLKQLIIQTSNLETISLYENLNSNPKIDCAPLIDPSGGNGLEINITQELFETNIPYFGIAGGINPENCDEIVSQILELDPQKRPFWIDMESSVRDENDYFSIEKCYAVCKKLEPFIK